MPTSKREASNIFLNFNDQRGEKAVAANDLVAKSVSSIPKGERVVLITSKAEFGRLSVPLDFAAAEVIN